MKRFVMSLVLLVAALSMSAGTRIIPVAGHLPGANGTSWTTDVSLTNNDAVATAAQLVFHAGNGITVSRTVQLPASGSLLLADAVRPDQFAGANASSWIGQLEIRSGANISASARTYTTAAIGGTYGSAYESYDPKVLTQEGAMSGLMHNAQFRSNVAYVNATDSTSVVFYTIRAENGSVLATNQLAVTPHSTLQVSLSRDLAPANDDSRVTVEWSATTPLYAIASVVDNRSNDPTNIPSANSATNLFFPVVGRTAGAQSTFWSTSAAVTSRADVAGNVTFAYRDNATGQLFTRTVGVPARGTVRADDVNGFVGANAGSGSLTITSTTRVVAAVRVFNTLEDGSTYGSALLPQQTAVRAPAVTIKGVRRDSAYRLNVSLSSGSAATSGTVRLLDDNGNEVQSEPFLLGHDAMTQINLNRGGDVRSGEIEVATNDGNSITAVASSIDNRTGDTSVREAEQENERRHDLEIRVSPKTANVGTAIAFTIGNTTGVQSVRWTFGDGTTGEGTSTSHAYSSAGEFDVIAEVTLTNGAVVRDREDVHVTGGTTPVSSGPIDFTWSPLAPQPGEAVTFTASRTTGGGSFKWKFPGNLRVFGAVASFTFPSAGAFEVELELEHDGSTNSPEVRHVVVVGNGGPSGNGPLSFTWSPAAPAPGDVITFTAAGGNGTGIYVFKFPGNIRKSGATVTHTFATAGSYEVELELEESGATVTPQVKRIVTVGGGSNNGGGAIDFTWSPLNPQPGELVTFTASGSNGNGTFVFKFPGNVRKSGNSVTFTFASAGSYEVELELEHGDTRQEAKHVVNVGNGGNNGGNNGGTATSVDFTWSPATVKAGQTVTFTATANGALPNGAFFKWKMPDDSRPTGPTATYTFKTAGTYRVEVELENVATDIEREKTIVVTQ
jgi:plastocyanin